MGLPPNPNELEREFWEELHRKDVAQEIDTSLLDVRDGFVLVRCGDAKHFKEQLETVLGLFGGPSREQVHPVTVNGGAIRGEVIIEDSVKALKMQKMRTAVLIIHLPCGEMRDVGMSPTEALERMFAAKKAIKKRALVRHNIEVRVLCLVFYWDGEKRHFRAVAGKRWASVTQMFTYIFPES